MLSFYEITSAGCDSEYEEQTTAGPHSSFFGTNVWVQTATIRCHLGPFLDNQSLFLPNNENANLET